MPIPVISVAQMREWEQSSWTAGCSVAAVIRRVGEILAARASRLTRDGDFILLLAGKGHNGDDARAAQPHLANRRVEILNVENPAADFAALENLLAQKPALIVDALFGIGVNRVLDAGWKKFIARVNDSRARVLAVDVPSGLNADNGETFGAAIVATHTLTLGAVKRGLLATAAAQFTGRVELAREIGLLPRAHKSEINWILPDDFAGFPPVRNAASHKGSHGHVALVAGSAGYHGAAVLAARGAQRAQPGLVTVLTLTEAFHPVASQMQSAMVGLWRADVKISDEFTAALFGPGLAARNVPEELKNNLRRLWLGAQIPIVVDASALDWLPLGLVPQNFTRVLTPHPGEAARLLQVRPAEVQADRVRAVRDLSRRFSNCWVVLKGYQTLIGRSTGEILVNSSGNAQLAQGGSGDLLAGYLVGALAQPELQADPLKAIAHAVWQHGAAADRLAAQKPNWIIEELASEIGAVRAADFSS